MFSEGEIKALTALASARASLAVPDADVAPYATRAVLPLLIAEAAAFALVAASGKIPEFLFTAVRALLTF